MAVDAPKKLCFEGDIRRKANPKGAQACAQSWQGQKDQRVSPRGVTA